MINELVKKAKKGDKKAFGALIEECKAECYKVAVSYMKNSDDAMDVVGDSVYKAFIGIRRLKKEEFFKTWLIRIVINTANSHLKKKERDKKFMGIFNYSSQERDRELVMDIKDAINKLDKKSKDIIILKYYSGYTIENISEILECPIGTVKSNLSRTLKKLKNQLQEIDEKGGIFEYETAEQR